MVKARAVRWMRSPAALRACIGYVQRDGVTRDGAPGKLFAAGDDADGRAFAERCASSGGPMSSFQRCRWRNNVGLKVQKRMAELCSHLLIDEAHHIAAKARSELKTEFHERPINALPD
jgi:hypothetical protein